MSAILERIAQAAAERENAEREYRSALLAAADAGISYARIAAAAGVTRQAVRELVLAIQARAAAS